MFTLTCTGVFWFQVNISAIRRFSVSLRQIQEVYNETRVFAYTHAYRRFLAPSVLPGRLIIRYHQPEADLLGKIKRIRCKKGIKTFRLLPDVLILRQC